MKKPHSQRELAQALLKKRGILRLAELREAGITSTTIHRMEKSGEVLRLSRGIYQLCDANLDLNHSMAVAAKRIPKGVVCLVSALLFHELTEQLPSKIWMAIGLKDWAPQPDGTPVRIVRFTDRLLSAEVETHVIESVPVKVFSVAKTVADCFRHRNKIGLPIAIEGFREALRWQKTTPAEIARQAQAGGVWTVIRPYLDALVANA